MRTFLLKAAFGTVDKVGGLYVFDIGGNKYRLIVDVRLRGYEKIYPLAPFWGRGLG